MEKTIESIIGQIIQLNTYSEFDRKFDDLVASISIGYKGITEEDTKKAVLIKYGFIDLTYQEGERFIRIFGKTEKSGISYYKSIDPKFDLMSTYRKYWQDIDSLFPLEFKIIDCCLTDDKYIWSEKYFYV